MIKAKFYRLFALIFAFVGFGVFLLVYHSQPGNDIIKMLSNPFILVLITFPFIPAMVLSWIAQRAEKSLEKMIDNEPS